MSDELRQRIAVAICNGVDPDRLPGLEPMVDRIMAVLALEAAAEANLRRALKILVGSDAISDAEFRAAAGAFLEDDVE